MATSKPHSHAGKSSEDKVDKALILKTLNIRPGQYVLDAGCGNGYMSREFSRLVGAEGKVYALDPHHESIETLQQATKDGNITALEADICHETPIESSSLDLIYISNVLHGLNDGEFTDFVGEVRRLLKVGGVLAVLDIVKGDTPFGPPQEIRISPDELTQRIPMQAQSLTIVASYLYLQLFRNM